MELKDFRKLKTEGFFYNKLPCDERIYSCCQALDEVKEVAGLYEFISSQNSIDLKMIKWIIFPQIIDFENLKIILDKVFISYKNFIPDTEMNDFLKQINPLNDGFEDLVNSRISSKGNSSEYDYYVIYNGKSSFFIYGFHETKPIELFKDYYIKVKKYFDEFESNKNELKKVQVPKPWENEITEDLFQFLIKEVGENPINADLNNIFEIMYINRIKLGEEFSSAQFYKWYRQNPDTKERKGQVNKTKKYLKLEEKADNFLLERLKKPN